MPFHLSSRHMYHCLWYDLIDTPHPRSALAVIFIWTFPSVLAFPQKVAVVLDSLYPRMDAGWFILYSLLGHGDDDSSFLFICCIAEHGSNESVYIASIFFLGDGSPVLT